ncbi:MAG: carboxypeptidase-like regulatory domain-containing protein [Planctomycetota bacterium]|nr:carboxypeptidase-like regulatory domain-containing protein [Planctomycetota bacterium]
MKRLLPIFAGLALIVASLTWYANRGDQSPGPDPATVGDTGPVANPGGKESAELVAEPTVEDITGGASTATADSDRTALEERDLAISGETFTLAGSVDLSDACGADEGLEVLALKEVSSYAKFIRRSSFGLSASPDRQVLARAAVEPDGSFSLEMPVDSAGAHLLVIGDQLYMDSTWDGEFVDQELPSPPLLVPTVGACIYGQLIPPTNSAVDLAGIKLSLRPDLSTFSTTSGALIPMISRSTESDEEGQFVFRGVPTGLEYTLGARPDDLAGSQTTFDDLTPCEARHLELSLSIGASLSGRVLAEGGQAIAGAKVQARLPGEWFGVGGERVRKATSAADGSFSLPAVMPGKIQVHAEADGYLEASGKTILVADADTVNDLELILETGGKIAGQVLWADGTPAPTAEVEVSFDPAHLAGLGAFNALKGASGEAQCQADGSFTVSGLGKGPFVVVATAEEQTSDEVEDPAQWTARMEGIKPNGEDLVLKLERPRMLVGRVVDGIAEPVLEFSLSASRRVEGPLGVSGQPPVQGEFSADDGSFALSGLTSGIWDLTANAKGYGASKVSALSFPQEEGAEPLLIVLQAEAVVEGTVFGPNGEPAAGAMVAVDTGEPAWKSRAQGGAQPPQTTSAEDGSYRLEGLAPGSLTLYAHGKEYARGPSVIIDASAGGVSRNVNLTVLEGGTLTGVIYGNDGKPAQGRMITVTNMGTFATSVTQSDRSGEFRIEHLDPGKLQVVAIDRDMDMAEMTGDGDGEANMGGLLSSMKMTMVEITDGDETHVVLGAPPEDPVRVSGRVTHAGEPYSGANVTFYSGGGKLMERMRLCSVDKEGHFETVLDGPGFYMVAIQKIHGGPGQQTSVEFRRDIPKQEEVHLDFAIPEGRISGRIFGADGKPAGGARVTLTVDGPMKSGLMMGGQYSENAADSEGRYDIPGLRPGTYALSVGGMPMGGMFGGEAQYSRVTRGSLRVDENQWLADVDFRLENPGSIEVTVLDDSRRPAAGAALFVRNQDGKLLERFSMAQTDGQGRFTYGGIAPGQYTVSARSVTEASADSPTLSVRAGESTPASLSLESGTMLLISLQDRDGNPVDASISVIDSNGRDVNGMLGLTQIMDIYGEGGLGLATHKVGPLAPGSYRVLAEDDEGHKANKPVRLAGQTERKLKLRLK